MRRIVESEVENAGEHGGPILKATAGQSLHRVGGTQAGRTFYASAFVSQNPTRCVFPTYRPIARIGFDQPPAALAQPQERRLRGAGSMFPY